METVGAYRVLGKLGEGGMGVVYLAEHSLLGRKAAIKVLHPTFSANPDIVQRFFNEAKAVTSIADPGIVQIFDFGHAPDGSAYIVMELLEGEPMDRRIRRIGRMSVDECLQLMRLVCHSLGAAHAKGIVHRDLKPENIYIVRDPAVPGGERPKVLDFGIAKLSTQENSAVRTRTGAMMGTPTYMSPEQCRGAGDVDARSDIYSIGCVIMAMLTGRPPFLSDAMGDLIVAHMTTPPPLASSFVSSVPHAIDQILQRCLAKDPNARFASMNDLAAAIDDVRGDTGPVLAARPSNAALKMPPAISVVAHTTLGGSAAQTAPPTEKNGRLGAVVGGFVVVAAAAGIAIGVLASKKVPPPSPSTSGSASASALIDAAVITAAPVDAPAVVASAPVDAPAVAVVPVDAAEPLPPVVASVESPTKTKKTTSKTMKAPVGPVVSPVPTIAPPSVKPPPPGPIPTLPPAPVATEKPADPEPAPALGELTAAQIAPVMNKIKSKLIACVDEDDDARYLHTMRVHVNVNAEGTVTSAVASDADANEVTTHGCVIKVVRATKFPASIKGASFNYPIRFR